MAKKFTRLTQALTAQAIRHLVQPEIQQRINDEGLTQEQVAKILGKRLEVRLSRSQTAHLCVAAGVTFPYAVKRAENAAQREAEKAAERQTVQPSLPIPDAGLEGAITVIRDKVAKLDAEINGLEAAIGERDGCVRELAARVKGMDSALERLVQQAKIHDRGQVQLFRRLKHLEDSLGVVPPLVAQPDTAHNFSI